MTIARAQLVDPSLTRWYHCISRCVRRAFLLAEGACNRKAWLEHRLQELAQCFAVAIGGFAVMDNHLHVLLRLDPQVLAGWTDEEVVRRWGRLYPPRDRKRQPSPVTDEWVQQQLQNAAWVATTRQRLGSLSWFMKCLKEPLSRLANREDQAGGAFFEGRFKSVAILDEESLLAICAYIDLNPVAASIAEVPETSEHTSIKQRVDHVQEQGRTADLQAAQAGSVAGSRAAAGLEEGLWLCPIEDRSHLDSPREGMLEGFTLGNYLLLIDYTGRLFRQGKVAISAEVGAIFERLGSGVENWQSRMRRLVSGRLLGRFFAATRLRLREVARNLGVNHLVNLAGCVSR